MDNIKSIIGNAGQDINKEVTGWLSAINNFIDKNRANIAKLVQNILTDISNMAVSAGLVFKDLFGIISTTLAEATNDTQKTTASQMTSWSQLFLYISGGWIGLMGTIRAVMAGFVGIVKMASHLIISTLIGVAGVIATSVGAFLMPIQILINTVIDGVNKFSDLLGTKPIQKMTIATTAIMQGVNAIKYSVTDGASFIGQAWEEMGMGVASAWYDSTEQIKANIAETKKEIKKDGNVSNVFGDITKTLDDMKKSLDNVKRGHGDAKSSAKEHAEAMKELKNKAEDAIKPIIEKIKDERKEIEESRKKIIETAQEWKKYKDEAIKAISDVNNELAKLKKEASDITNKSNAERDTAMAERLVEVYKDIEDKKKRISEMQGDNTDGSHTQDIIDAQNELVRLEQERDYIKSSVNEKIIAERQAYADMTKAQQIAYDAENQRQKDLAENTAKQNSLIEKRMILEAQANQKSITDMSIIVGMKDGMLTASVLDEKGVRQEIHDAENIALANEIFQKQLAYKTDVETLVKTLSDKLNAQKSHIDTVTVLYKDFNKFLSHDTKVTSETMISYLNQVNAQLKETIRLRQAAGFNSPVAGGTTPIAGARAEGGTVMQGESYLVGEKGPEIFTPGKTGYITPNNSIGGVKIDINFGNVSIKDDMDIRKLTDMISEELTRKLDLYKLGIK